MKIADQSPDIALPEVSLHQMDGLQCVENVFSALQ